LSSDGGHGASPFALSDLTTSLLPGETLQINRLGDGSAGTIASLVAAVEQEDKSWQVMTTLIRHLPVDAYDVPLASREVIATQTEGRKKTPTGSPDGVF
jgi:hypothetical protein